MGNILKAILDKPVLSLLIEPDFFGLFCITRKWFRITLELVASTIADMDSEPAVLADLEDLFIGARLL